MSKITVDVKATSVLTGWTDASAAAYEPIVWSINGTSVASNTGGGTGSFGALKYALGQLSIYCEPGDDLSDAGFDYEISWDWPFSTGSTNDVKDTFLGNKTTAPTVTLEFDILVEQVN